MELERLGWSPHGGCGSLLSFPLLQCWAGIQASACVRQVFSQQILLPQPAGLRSVRARFLAALGLKLALVCAETLVAQCLPGMQGFGCQPQQCIKQKQGSSTHTGRAPVFVRREPGCSLRPLDGRRLLPESLGHPGVSGPPSC